MARLTQRKKKNIECRCGNCNEIEAWIEDMSGDTRHMCDNCPIQVAFNKLAEYEDKEEATEDDGK